MEGQRLMMSVTDQLDSLPLARTDPWISKATQRPG